jgi:hypothetical protein
VIGHVAWLEGMRNAYTNLIRKPEEDRLLRRSRCRWEDNIKIDLKDIGCEMWSGLIWLTIVKKVMCDVQLP